MMDTLIFKPGRLAIMLGTAAFLVALPVKFDFDGEGGLVPFKATQALASSGDDDGGDDEDHDGNSHDSHDDDGHDDDGHDDDDHDDDGHDDDGHDDDGHDEDDHDEDDHDDDGYDDDGYDDDATTGGTNDGASGGSNVLKIEVSSAGVEVTYSDGSKEKIENGVYERKDAMGNTVEKRPANQADIDRLFALR